MKLDGFCRADTLGAVRRNIIVKIIVQDYGWIHLSLGRLGNLTFCAGSILFLPQFELYKDIGVWLFVIGEFLMLLPLLTEKEQNTGPQIKKLTGIFRNRCCRVHLQQGRPQE